MTAGKLLMHNIIGRIAAFNVDPDFSDVLDAMILVDMAAIPAAQQAKYMGKEGAHRYQAFYLVFVS